jgi:predicted ABC-type transport system involved in lysophospholipase L1 biosynthesis ATPase subunit
MNCEDPVLELRNVTCVRPAARLEAVTLGLAAGTMNLLVADAESSLLLLRVASLQETPDSGEVAIGGEVFSDFGAEECESVRSRFFGFLYSAPYVLPGLSILENIAMPLLRIPGRESKDVAEKTQAALAFVGLADRLNEDAGDLSRFDQHRLALGRALAHEPRILLLDRVEGNLAADEAVLFRELIEQACSERGIAVLASITAVPVQCRADRVIRLEAGTISDLSTPTNP